MFSLKVVTCNILGDRMVHSFDAVVWFNVERRDGHPFLIVRVKRGDIFSSVSFPLRKVVSLEIF